MSLKLVVWDVDGTLVDSRASIFKALQEAAVTVGLDAPTYDEVRQIVGLSLLEAVRHMRPDLAPDRAEAYASAYKQAFIRMHGDPDFHEPLYPGAEETLRRLKRDGWLIGMATGKSRRGIERNTEVYGWGDVFDTSFCADDGPSKPHPHMLDCNMVALGVDAHQTVMIGDTTHDIHMGRAAKVRTIGVSWGFHTVEELQAAGADVIVHDFNQLNAALDAFVLENML
ncbi:HAD-IA family hydrolase [Asticcacaulis solisilvae]|uniref:HAD-IA family hydrolase n=1 Tax=Asticcacaulis solisilvae TaxID=1217274 RepID=UPI003FD6DD7B